MSDSDPVRRSLREGGCQEHVVRAGLAGLVEAWENTVAQVEAGYPLGFDDYLNDMDGRQILEAALLAAGPSAECADRVRAADARMKKLVHPADKCLWGKPTADAEGWTPTENWWYFSLPRHLGPLLREDLRGGIAGGAGGRRHHARRLAGRCLGMAPHALRHPFASLLIEAGKPLTRGDRRAVDHLHLR